MKHLRNLNEAFITKLLKQADGVLSETTIYRNNKFPVNFYDIILAIFENTLKPPLKRLCY